MIFQSKCYKILHYFLSLDYSHNPKNKLLIVVAIDAIHHMPNLITKPKH
jgi:hypothetical protein